jgi:hypothetical protein
MEWNSIVFASIFCREKASMPFKEETRIIRGFDQILTELAIFRTRKVHLPV